MSGAEDRFIAGEGALAALIRAQPAFEAPPHMLGRILAALEAAPAPTGFEPPAALLDAVMAEADRIDAAQAPRREALMAELAAGKAAEEVLGARLSPATAQWLAARRPPPAPAPPRRRRWPWLAGLGTAITAALALSVTLRVVQAPAPPPTPVVTSAPAPAESRAQAVAGPAAAADAAPERLPRDEAVHAKLGRAGEKPAHEPELAPAAPAAPAAPPQARSPAASMAAGAVADPAAEVWAMAEIRRRAPARSAGMHAEADEVRAPEVLVDAALDTPPATLAERLLASPAQAWTMTVAPSDGRAGEALRTALGHHLATAGRDDAIALRIGPVAPGRIRITASE